MKNCYFILALVWLLGSCYKPQKPFLQLELLAIGSPEIIDTLNLMKIGAPRYYVIDSNMDSVLMKSYDVINQQTGDVEYPITSTYHKIALPLSTKSALDSIIPYLKSLPNGQLPGTKRPKGYHSCHSFSGWIAILTDGLGKKHYYTFTNYNINPHLKQLRDDLIQASHSRQSHPSQPNLPYINTDSLVCYCENEVHIDFGEVMPPPLKSTVKFTPPEIKME